MKTPTLGALVQSFLIDHLRGLKGLRPSSIRSYRDALRLFLLFAAADARRKITRLAPADLTFERVQGFLSHLEQERGNHIRTRNHRLAVLHSFFDYLAGRAPEMLAVCQRVAAIPAKRAAPPETDFLEREEVAELMANLPSEGKHALRDRALLLFLYNTGARAQETADVRIADLELDPPASVRLHGKGGRWRTCPLWAETARQLKALTRRPGADAAESPVFASQCGGALTRFGIYKIVRCHAGCLGAGKHRISPHLFRHTAAVHLLEAGVEVNVIRGWLGHVSLETTNRYAEINMRAKEAALRACEPDTGSFGREPAWRDDEMLLAWLDSL